MAKSIIYSGFDQNVSEFISSTPQKKRPKRRSFCTSQESRGYGTMKSRVETARQPRCNEISYPTLRDRMVNTLPSDSSDDVLIAPPCSLDGSVNEDPDQLLDYDPNMYDDVFHTPVRTTNGYKNRTQPVRKPQCGKCGKKFHSKTKLKLHHDRIHPSDMMVLMVL